MIEVWCHGVHCREETTSAVRQPGGVDMARASGRPATPEVRKLVRETMCFPLFLSLAYDVMFQLSNQQFLDDLRQKRVKGVLSLGACLYFYVCLHIYWFICLLIFLLFYLYFYLFIYLFNHLHYHSNIFESKVTTCQLLPWVELIRMRLTANFPWLLILVQICFQRILFFIFFMFFVSWQKARWI